MTTAHAATRVSIVARFHSERVDKAVLHAIASPAADTPPATTNGAAPLIRSIAALQAPTSAKATMKMIEQNTSISTTTMPLRRF